MEGYGFKRFMENIGIKILPRKSIPERINEIREITKESIKEKMVDIKHICLYIDHWTYFGEKYLAIFSSHIENYQNIFMLLGFIRVYDKASATTPSELQKIMNIYDLNLKIKYINSDSAQDMVCTVKRLRLPLHIHCFSHRLHNTIINSFNISKLDVITKKIVRLSDDVNRNASFYTEFNKYLRSKNYNLDVIKSISTKLKKFVVTRWSSLYIMIKDFYKKYQYLREFIDSKDGYNESIYPDNSDYLLSKHILDILEELSELQYMFMKNSKGNICKVLFRISILTTE